MRLWPCALLFAAAVVACGARTGLLTPDDGEPPGPDAGSDVEDDSGRPLRDAGRDATADAEEPKDALPPIDVTVPVDAFNDCPDAGSTFIYVVTEEFELLSFYPPTAEFVPIGTLDCPTNDPGATPFSMAVDHTGVAYVLYSDPTNPSYVPELFRVSTATAACRATGFAAGQMNFSTTFGMGYSHDDTGPDETLYVAGESNVPRLATIDTTTFGLRVVGNLKPPIGNAELTGTGAGDLFAFYATNGPTYCDNLQGPGKCADSAIGQLDKATGQVTNQSVLTGLAQGDAWAFAFWGGDFYTFTAPIAGLGSRVERFRPSDGSLVTVTERSDKIVGAGVSTCAPAL